MISEADILETDEVGCRLILRLPTDLAGSFAQEKLSDSLKTARAAALVLPFGCTRLNERAALCREVGVACFLADDIDSALSFRLDGLELSGDAQLITHARRRLPENTILAARCPIERHTPMEVGEAGADLVVFDANSQDDFDDALDLVAWWTSLFTLPALVRGSFTLEQTERLAEAGADFVDPGAHVWLSGSEMLEAYQDAVDTGWFPR